MTENHITYSYFIDKYWLICQLGPKKIRHFYIADDKTRYDKRIIENGEIYFNAKDTCIRLQMFKKPDFMMEAYIKYLVWPIPVVIDVFIKIPCATYGYNHVLPPTAMPSAIP